MEPRRTNPRSKILCSEISFVLFTANYTQTKKIASEKQKAYIITKGLPFNEIRKMRIYMCVEKIIPDHRFERECEYTKEYERFI